MRALSLWQPWASAIAAGAKKIETRGWKTDYRGLVAIHAAKVWTSTQREAAMRLLPEIEGFTSVGGASMVAVATWVQDPAAWPRGVVVALASLTDCVPTERLHPGEREGFWGDYSPGRFAWLLEGVRALELPYSMRGRQGLWRPTEQEEREILLRRTRPAGEG